jgi:hypothetical protein
VVLDGARGQLHEGVLEGSPLYRQLVEFQLMGARHGADPRGIEAPDHQYSRLDLCYRDVGSGQEAAELSRVW